MIFEQANMSKVIADFIIASVKIVNRFSSKSKLPSKNVLNVIYVENGIAISANNRIKTILVNSGYLKKNRFPMKS